MSGGRERAYRLFVPPGYDGRTALPLVLEMHGSGGTSAGQSRTSGFDAVAAREGFAVASLQADGGRWNVPIRDGRPDDVAYVSDVIDDIAAQLCTDRTRVYATGFSGGDALAIALCCFSALAIWLAGSRQIRAVAGRVLLMSQFGAKQ